MKKTIFLLAFILLIVSLPLYAWAQSFETLQKIAQKNNTANSWNNLAEYLYNKRENPLLLKEATQNSIELAQKDGNSQELARGYIYASDLLWQEGSIEEYMSTNKKALELLKSSTNYSLKEVALNNVATAFGEQDRIDSLIYYVSKAVELNSKYGGSKQNLGNEYQNLAYAYSIKGIVDSSIFYTQKTIDALQLAKDTLPLLDAYNQMAVVYVKNKDYPKALNYFNEALELYEHIENKHNRLYIYTNLAAMYQKWNKLDQALEFGRKALSDAQNSNEKMTYGKLLCNLGVHLYRNRNYSSSIDTLSLALPLIKESHYYLGTTCQLLGNNYIALNKIDSSKYYLAIVDSLANINQFSRGELFYAAKAEILTKQGKLKEAVPFIKEFIKLDSKKELKDADPLIYSMVAEVLEKSSEDYKQALFYKKLAYSIQDSIYRKESNSKLNEFFVKYKSAEKDLEISQLNEKQAKWGALVSILSVIAAIFLIAALYYRIKKLRKEKETILLTNRIKEKESDYKDLQQDLQNKLSEQYIAGLETERNRLAKELHDGIGNELLGIIMQITNDGDKLAITHKLNDTYHNVRNLSHSLIPPKLTNITFAIILEDFVRKHNDASKTQMKLNISSSFDSWKDLPASYALEAYRIIQEAVSNSLKHADASSITLVASFEDNLLSVCIMDDGKGFDVDSPNKGIGIKIMKERAKQMNSVLEIHSEISKGTQIAFQFNIPSFS